MMAHTRSLVRGLLSGALLVAAVTQPAHGQVRVGVNIDLLLPGPPSLVVVPGAPVYYAPQAPANVFFFAHQYWAFAGGGWYVGPGWSGPWVVVEPAYVPVPLLRVPVRYYRAPPPGWKGWRRGAPPQWGAQYGHAWREDARERSWREGEEHWNRGGGKGCPPGHAKKDRC